MSDPHDNRFREERQPFNFEGATPYAPPAKPGAQGPFRAKIFKSGNSLALRLPAALGLEAGMEMELTVEAAGAYALRAANAPKRKIDVSKFAGKAPWLKELTREDREFEHSPRPWDDPDWLGWKARDQ
jgi:antitoxin VapB